MNNLRPKLHRAETRFTTWLVAHSLWLLRVSLGAIFLLFGMLKFVPGLRACANRLATFRTWRFSERLNSLFIAYCHVCYSPIGAAS